MSIPWPTSSVSMSNGHARRIKVSDFLPAWFLSSLCLADLNERDSLEMVQKQVRKIILRGLGE